MPSRGQPPSTGPAAQELAAAAGRRSLGERLLALEAESFLDEDHRHTPRDDHTVDDQDVVHRASRAVGAAGAVVLEWQAVVVDAPQGGGKIGDDLLGTEDEDHVPGA